MVDGILWDVPFHAWYTVGWYGLLGVRHREVWYWHSVYQLPFVCPVYVSVLLSYTVLLELYQEKLLSNNDMKRMKGEGVYLSYRVVHVQCTKPPEVVIRTTDVLDKYGYKKEARQLRGW